MTEKLAGDEMIVEPSVAFEESAVRGGREVDRGAVHEDFDEPFAGQNRVADAGIPDAQPRPGTAEIGGFDSATHHPLRQCPDYR